MALFRNGVLSRVSSGIQQATGALGQAASSAGLPTQITGAIGDIGGRLDSIGKDIGQSIFGGGAVGGALNFMSALRSANIPGIGGLPTGAGRAPASFSGGNLEEKDWRVSLSMPSSPSAFSKSPMLDPLKVTKNRMIFPFTPTILLQHSANYQSVNPVHTNYPFHAYSSSQVNEIVITGQFYCQNELEAQYWTACLHYLRSVTKMDYGMFAETGAPPPIVKLNGYGDYVFNNVPVVITTFTVDMPSEVDYIATGIKGKSLSTTDGYSWAPAESQFSVSCMPIYSRQSQTIFNYNMFVGGHDIGRGYI